jgi:hypothetical protein
MEYLDYLDDIYEELVDEFGEDITTKNLVDINCQVCDVYILTATKDEAEDLTATCLSCW